MAKTILIIEDETAIQNIVRAFLEDAGYTVYSAGDGLEGIETFRRCNPDLVLLDLMLPKIDGFAVCEILRKESRTPIIMLTARDDDASQMKGFDVLADDYIIKPFSMPLVLRRIEAVLRRTEQGNEEEPSVIRYKEITLDGDSGNNAFNVCITKKHIWSYYYCFSFNNHPNLFITRYRRIYLESYIVFIPIQNCRFLFPVLYCLQYRKCGNKVARYGNDSKRCRSCYIFCN